MSNSIPVASVVAQLSRGVPAPTGKDHRPLAGKALARALKGRRDRAIKKIVKYQLATLDQSLTSVADLAPSARLVYEWGLGHPGGVPASQVASELSLSSKTVKRAHVVLAQRGLAAYSDVSRYRGGRETHWTYSTGIVLIDLTPLRDLDRRTSGDHDRGTATPATLSPCQDQWIMPATCENAPFGGQEGDRLVTEESESVLRPEERLSEPAAGVVGEVDLLTHTSVGAEPQHARTCARDAASLATPRADSLSSPRLVEAFWASYAKRLAESDRYAPYGTHETQIRQALDEHLSRHSLIDVRDALAYLFEKSHAPHSPKAFTGYLAGYLAGQPTWDHLEGKPFWLDLAWREMAVVPGEEDEQLLDAKRRELGMPEPEPEPEPQIAPEPPAPVRPSAAWLAAQAALGELRAKNDRLVASTRERPAQPRKQHERATAAQLAGRVDEESPHFVILPG